MLKLKSLNFLYSNAILWTNIWSLIWFRKFRTKQGKYVQFHLMSPPPPFFPSSPFPPRAKGKRKARGVKWGCGNPSLKCHILKENLFWFWLLCYTSLPTECRKTKTKVITLANHKGLRAIHCPIKTRSNYTKRGKTCASKSRLVLVLLVIGWLVEFLRPITKRSNAKPK